VTNRISAPVLTSGQTLLPEKPSQVESLKIKEAALQFEALLIGQMLRIMHEASQGGGLSPESDQAGQSMSEFAEQRLSDVLASQGGIGLASLIEQGLHRSDQPQKLKCTDSCSA
jgi:Rod binding domain-containing protein